MQDPLSNIGSVHAPGLSSTFGTSYRSWVPLTYHCLIMIEAIGKWPYLLKKNLNLISNLFIKLKDLDFNQKISSTILFNLVASTFNSKNYPNFLVGIRIHLDCTQAQLWLANPCISKGRFITNCFSKQFLVILILPQKPNQ